MTVEQDAATSAELDGFYRDLDAANLRPLWRISADLLPPRPKPRALPWLWPARVMHPLADRALALVPVGRGGERRVLSLANPGLGGAPYAAGTLWAAIQCLGPGETAPAHRHTPGAIRFVLTGSGVWTTVNGDACDMGPGDLVLTPAWHWHDHVSAGEGRMYWFDGLDLPMIEALDAVFFEPHPELRQPVAGRNLSEREYAGRPGRLGEDGLGRALDPRPSRLLVYRWADTDAALARIAAERGGAMASVEFVNPDTGASVLPTLSCSMHRLAPGRPTPPVRRTGNAVAVVFAGRGRSVVDGTELAWSEGDMFVIPSWSAAEHVSDGGADLFMLSDAPVLRALGVYREETLPGPQQVVSTFQPAG